MPFSAHPTKLLLISQLHLFITILLLHLFFHNSALLRSFGFPSSALRHPPIIASFIVGQLITAPLDQVFHLMINTLTRKFEYEADEFAVEVGGEEMGGKLKDGLKKLHVENLATVNTDWL